MCGIAGILSLDPGRPVRQAPLGAMAAALSHRGPDSEGFHLDRELGLAYRRLSIIDLSDAANQPMSNEDGSLWMVFNGEIYNEPELRREMLARGHRFRSGSDAEVVLHLYEEHGPGCVEVLNGMFAFAIWDARQRQLFAARDHFGVKPFYYAVAGEMLIFASEIKALFATDLIAPDYDRAALSEYLTFQFCLGDTTLFKAVRKLEPGCWLRAEPGRGVEIRRYWDLDFRVDEHAPPEDECVQRLRVLLDDAVRDQMRADVPVGAHLSGGLDSSSVVALAAKHSRSPLHTFSGAFREGPDERPHARAVSEAAGTVHHEVFPTERELVELLPLLIYHMDEPAAGPGVFPQYCVSKLAREHVTVVLGGQGGDEMFGGYTRYLIAYLEECIRGGIDGTQEDDRYVVTFESILPNLPQLRGYQPLLQHFWRDGVFNSPEHRYFRLIDRSSAIRDLVLGDLPVGDEGTLFERFHAIFDPEGSKSYINRMTRFDLKTILPALLHVEDRTSMAVSLESRVPLLDHRVAAFVAALPPKIKYRGGRAKHLFRRAVEPLLPASVTARTDKMGFPVPFTEWTHRSPVREFVHDTLLGSRARQRGLVDVDRLERRIQSEEHYGRGIWGLLCIELWMQTFIDRPVARLA
jgi:asparagine synthase (glutamine-hydrolysing)